MGKLSGLRQCLSLSSQSKVLSAAVRMIAEPETKVKEPKDYFLNILLLFCLFPQNSRG